MPKYGAYQRESSREEREARKAIHPVWRGVGFALIILIPLLSYAAMQVLLQQNTVNNWFPLPVDLAASPGDFLYTGDPWIYFKILVTVVIMLVLFALLTFFTFLVNSVFAPPQYGPFDVPPIKGRVRKRAR